MSYKRYSRIILAISISASLAACNGNEKTEEKATNTDAGATSTDAAPVTTAADNTDAVKAAPNLYKVVADTLGIRITDVVYKPGDSSATHWHPDYALYAIQGGTAAFYGKDGSRMENEMKSGMMAIRPGEAHSVKNIGKGDIHVMLVEVNRSGAASSPDALDATKTASKFYKAKADSMGIRIVEVSYKPGEQSAMHSHPHLALYVVEPGKAEFTRKDGSKQVMDLTKGMTAVVPADAHSAKNVGKTTFKGILVEVYRAMK